MKTAPCLLLLLFVSGAALADDDAMLKCRSLGDTASRLACYDAIPVGKARATPPAKTAEQSFGMETVKKAEEAPMAIDSTIAGDFDGWGPNARIKLANGQVWQVVDGSEAVLSRMSNPKVRIERNFVGTLFLHVEGSNNFAKVRRVQ
jgi:hypothetical protein